MQSKPTPKPAKTKTNSAQTVRKSRRSFPQPSPFARQRFPFCRSPSPSFVRFLQHRQPPFLAPFPTAFLAFLKSPLQAANPSPNRAAKSCQKLRKGFRSPQSWRATAPPKRAFSPPTTSQFLSERRAFPRFSPPASPLLSSAKSNSAETGQRPE